jgi:EAL domain-containing protein (putative c-di-GMP-specific phosphodiesterase class I)/GGDEF domain-containing protein
VPTFSTLRTKLTVFYAALFGVTLITIAAIVFIAVANNASRVVQNELQANAQVFSRIWQMRADQLHDSTDVLARDFGFRDAVASRDAATINSALNNLRARLGLDRAFLLTTDGAVIGLERPLDPNTTSALWSALDATPDASGILLIDGQPYQAVAAPVRAPDTIGWVVFAAALNDAQMRAFENLAPIDLRAQPFTRPMHGAWMSHAEIARTELPSYVALLSRPPGHPYTLALPSGSTLALTTPLRSILPDNAGASTVLVLSYPLAHALAPYQLLLWLVAGVGLFGLVLVGFGSWALARSLTRPISALDDAAQRLQKGEEVHVEVSTKDEIARLADSFNGMAAGIRERERRIRHMAMHDPESRLPNRRAFEARLAKRNLNDRPYFVAAIGINRYEHVRGAIGYELAAALVRALGERLVSIFGAARVARLSTDKIGVIFEAPAGGDALASAERIQAKIEQPLRVGDFAIDVTTTIGFAKAGANADPGALITQASVAIAQAVKDQRRAALFDADAYGDPSNNLALISELYAAMHSGDAWLAYQPKFDLRQEKIIGAEALMRWRHPQRGMISPDLFITMAEETGHVRGLTEWVLRQSIADQIALREQGHDLVVSVNVSGRLLGDGAFAARALDMIQSAKARIIFEITETALIGNAQQALDTLSAWRGAGVGVSIDDYGAGLSSLTYLKQIRAEELKIDKSFVLSLAQSRRDALLVKSTIDLAHGLGMKVTAEGVETPDTLALLSSMGCDIAQGYLIGRPVALAELIASLASREPHSAQLSA